VAVERAWGAFIRPDALLSGLGQPARLVPVGPSLALGPARGEADGSEADGEAKPQRFHEAMLSGDALAPTELLLSGEAERGEVTLILAEPLEVRLIRPDGASETLPIDAADGRYYATITELPEGEYCLAFLRPDDWPKAV
jgi:hypothetical protein